MTTRRTFGWGLLMLTLLALVLLVPRPAWAIEYEIFIDIDDEEQLYDLFVTEQISEDTYDTLLELRRRGIDLNTATRDQLYTLPNLNYDDVDAILAYRAEAGVIHAPADLVAAGVLSRDKLGSILTFISASDVKAKLTATHGWIRYQTGWSQTDQGVPPMVLQARVTTLRQLTIGVAGFVVRQQTGNPVWDPTRDSLMAPELGPRVRVPKVFAEWNGEKFGIIAGNYQIGFGQRLTIDTTTRYTPNGFVIDDSVRPQRDLTRRCRESAGELAETPCPEGDDDPLYYTTKDFRWRDAMRGVAVGAKHLSLPVGWMQLYGFGSWQRRPVYQYDLINRDTCDDPRTCASAEVLVLNKDQDLLAPTSEHRWATMPNLYDELLGGGNLTWFYDRRTHVGVTGYGANALWRIEGATLDFKDSAPTPFGGAWGAVGVDAAWGHRWSDLGIELARSFDSMKSLLPVGSDYGGGGFAGIVRQTSTFGSHEVEVSARYYDQNYANPYAGPISQADQYHGNRARDEAGGRIRYGGRVAKRLDLRGVADVWVQPSEGSPKIQTYARADVDVNDWFRPGLWLQYRNVDMRPNSKVGCVDDGTAAEQSDRNEDGSINFRSGCLAEVGQITGRFGFQPLQGKLSIIAQYQHEFIDDVSIDTRLRQDALATLIVRAAPISSLRLSARLRYLFEDIQDNTYLEQSVWAYFDASYIIKRMFLIRLRYDVFQWVDERDSTASRVPNPEHRLRLELEARF
jgi:Helix-hairpin-helix motif